MLITAATPLCCRTHPAAHPPARPPARPVGARQDPALHEPRRARLLPRGAAPAGAAAAGVRRGAGAGRLGRGQHQRPHPRHVPRAPAARDCRARRRQQLRLLGDARRHGAAGARASVCARFADRATGGDTPAPIHPAQITSNLYSLHAGLVQAHPLRQVCGRGQVPQADGRVPSADRAAGQRRHPGAVDRPGGGAQGVCVCGGGGSCAVGDH